MQLFQLKRLALWAGIFSVLWLHAGCMSPNQQLDRTAVTQLQAGQTQEEVRRIFGTPKQSEVGSNGKRLDIFRVVQRKISAGTSATRVLEMRSLHVLYNPQGQVEDFSYYIGEATGSYRANKEWEAGRRLGPDEANRIKRGVTSRENLVQMFGPATVEGLNVYGNTVMGWFFARGQRGSLTSGRELWVVLDAKSVARDFSLRDTQR